MKVVFLLYVFFAVVILDLGFSKNVLQEEIANYMDKFLFVKNSEKFCERDHLLLAQSTDKLFNLSKVLDICEAKQQCDFISFSPKRQLRNSIHYENDEPLKSTGANWICSGDDWVVSRSRKYWITAVKYENIQKQMKSYDLTMNMTGECDEKNILLKIKKFITPKEASQECDRLSTCRYIIFNYSHQIGKDTSDEDRIILCSAIPLGRINKLGYFLAGKQEKAPYKPKPKREKKKIQLNDTKGGSVIPDDYYKSYNKGEIVYSTNV